MQDYMPAKRPYELKTNSFPMQNFVYGNKTLIHTKGLHEYEIFKNELRLCLLRCTGTIPNPKNPARAIPAGPDLKIPNAQMLGKYDMEFAISFEKAQNSFSVLDDFMQNYVTIDGSADKDINIKIDKLEKDTYYYGMSKNKKILYNIKEDKVTLR